MFEITDKPLDEDVSAVIPLSERGAQAKDLRIERSQFGRADSLRYAILSMVVDGSYDAAIRELRLYQKSKQEYPRFEGRAERFVEYACDLINAVRAKRNFPGFSMLRQAKRQELNERIHEHFNELKHILIKIENIEVDLRVEDLRSTVWFLQTACYCVFAIFALAVLLDIIKYQYWYSAFHVTEVTFSWLTDFIVGLF